MITGLHLIRCGPFYIIIKPNQKINKNTNKITMFLLNNRLKFCQCYDIIY